MKPELVKLMPPLDGIVAGLYKEMGKISQTFVSIESRLNKFDATLKAFNGKLKRIEKYAK